ncbi:MAG TPA: hypothetical protein VN181_02960 [Thermoanaerobaculia bacterium]|nr:hypothetical protein [Thermoanaerobaculia bacterium]
MGNPAIDRVLHDIGGIDTSASSFLRGTQGTWNGRDVQFELAGGTELPKRAVVRIAAAAPCRCRIRHRDSADLYAGGPPEIDCALAMQRMTVWSDEASLPQQLFSDGRLAARLALAVVAKGDAIEINHDSIRVEQSLTRFDGEYAAFYSAWRAATEIIERMSFATTPDGRLPLVEVRDAMAMRGD